MTKVSSFTRRSCRPSPFGFLRRTLGDGWQQIADPLSERNRGQPAGVWPAACRAHSVNPKRQTRLRVQGVSACCSVMVAAVISVISMLRRRKAVTAGLPKARRTPLRRRSRGRRFPATFAGEGTARVHPPASCDGAGRRSWHWLPRRIIAVDVHPW